MTKSWTVALGCALALLVTAACDEGNAPESPQPSPEMEVRSVSSRCGDLDSALARGTDLGGRLRGDITGDGSEDLVYLVRDPDGERGCTDLLFVETETAVLASELTGDREPTLPQPRLSSLAAIDPEPGAEIVVDLDQGASTQFAGMFTVHEGDLQRVRVPAEGGLSDLFPYGGSVGHIETSDCGEGEGTVIVSFATPVRHRYQVQRSLYRFEGFELVLDRSASERINVAAEEVQDLPEYRSPPFGSCAST